MSVKLETSPGGTFAASQQLAERKPPKSPTRRRFKEEESKAGPSGIRNPENDHRHELDDDNDDDDDAWNKTRSRKKLTYLRFSRERGGPFSISEQEIMIRYLLKKGKVGKAKGLVVWRQMIDDG
ncbi:uncharacterized protein [Venturia canescens]|uniref:uncharacterized protein n=1 Tax=Venturia canescens TaxID=32260 RepID=UPI001C9D16AB|nr:uncharacterized protein LOC122411461 [Venturia canescens]